MSGSGFRVFISHLGNPPDIAVKGHFSGQHHHPGRVCPYGYMIDILYLCPFVFIHIYNIITYPSQRSYMSCHCSWHAKALKHLSKLLNSHLQQTLACKNEQSSQSSRICQGLQVHESRSLIPFNPLFLSSK